ncbi:hypothetical protein SNS2_5075 [Streptomyces netropsis]|nr:hypothetical protein SNS2_5075 [Streptomyces netropsis]
MTGGGAGDGPEAFVCGEVRTCLLQTSASLPRAEAVRLLRLRSDEAVRFSERPNLYAVSPEVLTGVDCALPAATGSRVRAVGTVRARAVLTEGRVLQATARFSSPVSGPDRRLPWGHYLVRPGVVQPLGRLSVPDVAAGFLGARPAVPDRHAAATVDLGAIAERLLARVLGQPLLDRRAPFKSRRTMLRWFAVHAAAGQGPPTAEFTVAADGLRTLRISAAGLDAAEIAGFCEELALHDWLLTTLIRMIDRSRLGSTAGTEAVLALRPAVDHLLHLWMPGARTGAGPAPLWDGLERHPGFTRQWQTLVQRIRDQVALRAVPFRCQA